MFNISNLEIQEIKRERKKKKYLSPKVEKNPAIPQKQNFMHQKKPKVLF